MAPHTEVLALDAMVGHQGVIGLPLLQQRLRHGAVHVLPLAEQQHAVDHVPRAVHLPGRAQVSFQVCRRMFGRVLCAFRGWAMYIHTYGVYK